MAVVEDTLIKSDMQIRVYSETGEKYGYRKALG